MKILYDYQHLYSQRIGGVSRIYAELIKEYKLSGDEIDVGLEYSNNLYLKQIEGLDIKPYYAVDEFLFGLNFRGKLRIYQQFQKIGFIKNFEKHNKLLSIEKLKAQNFDVFHPTFYNPYFLEYIGNKPFVLTILDLIYEKFRNDDIAKKERESKILLSKKASKIIAISESTKKDAIEILGIPEGKIEVIHLGNSLKNEAIEDQDFVAKLPSRYILFVGGRIDYKNFNSFYDALLPLLRNDKSLHLVCTGHPFTPQENIKFNINGVVDQVHFIFAEEKDFATLYSRALSFVFPSKYEGFGIPILEAFACECPVICSNLSSLPEVAGDAALYIDPNNVQGMTDVLNRVVNDESLRKSLIVKGTRRLEDFSWQKTAEQTYKVYESVI
jgi:glycosyltransferase involved in cell wall biosynthesis